MRDTMATKKKRKATHLVSVCGSEDARVTSWSEHAQCVRAARESVRAVELVRVRSKCVTAPATHETTARARGSPAAPAVHLSARQKRARRAVIRPSRNRLFGRPLQAATVEQVDHNTIQDTSYRVRFYSVGMHFDARKPATGGGGGSTCYYDGDGDA